MPCATSVIRKACARFPGSVLRAVTPFWAHPVRPLRPLRPVACPKLCCFLMETALRTSLNIAPKLLLSSQITQPNIVQNPSLLPNYATRLRSKSFPFPKLGEAKKVLGEICGTRKQKMDAQNRPKIIKFQHKFLPFLRFVKNETAPGSPLSGPAAFFGSIFLIYVGFGGHVGRLFPPILINGRRNNPQK